MYIDSHTHYDDRRFETDRDVLLESLAESGVTAVVNAGSSMGSSHASIALAEKYPFVYAAVGVHPHEAVNMTDDDEGTIKKLCEHKKVVAIGEIGLDYHYDNSPRDVQKARFAEQLALARDLDLPVIIHSREAASDTFDIIKKSGVKKGVLHCYSGHLPMAEEYIEMGFYIGLGGVATYKNAVKTVEVAAGVPLDRLLIETDCPYLAPVPFRGKRNDSSKLPFIAEAIAKIKGIKKEEAAAATAENAVRVFGLNIL